MINKRMAIITSLGVAATLMMSPTLTEGTSLPVVGETITLEDIVDTLPGQRVLDRDNDGQHYVLYLFDGHTVRRTQGENVVWVNGRPAPFDVGQVDGVWVPKPASSHSLSEPFRFPAQLIPHYFDYPLTDGLIVLRDEPAPSEPEEDVVDESPADTPEPTLPDMPEEPTEETENHDDDQRPESDEDLTPPDDTPTPDTDEGETSDKETDETPAPDTDTGEETDTSEVPMDEEDADDEGDEDEPDDETEAVEIGNATRTYDRANWWVHRDLDNAHTFTLQDETFALHYSRENIVVLTWVEQNQEVSRNLHHGLNPTVTFERENGDYYTIELDFIDSRSQGLSLSHVNAYINDVHEDIVVDTDDGSIHLYFEHEEFNLRESLFTQTEEALLHLGVQRFQVNRESGRWDIWFELGDSTW